MKFCTIDYVGELLNPHAKFGWRPKKGCPLGLEVKLTMTQRVIFIFNSRALLQLTLKVWLSTQCTKIRILVANIFLGVNLFARCYRHPFYHKQTHCRGPASILL